MPLFIHSRCVHQFRIIFCEYSRELSKLRTGLPKVGKVKSNYFITVSRVFDNLIPIARKNLEVNVVYSLFVCCAIIRLPKIICPLALWNNLCYNPAELLLRIELLLPHVYEFPVRLKTRGIHFLFLNISWLYVTSIL